MKVFKIKNIKTGQYVGRALADEGYPKVWSSISAAKSALAAAQRYHGLKISDYQIEVFELAFVDTIPYRGRVRPHG